MPRAKSTWTKKSPPISAAVLKDFFDTADHHMVTVGLMKTQFCFRRAPTPQKKDIKDLETKIDAIVAKVRQHKRHQLTSAQVKAFKTTLSLHVHLLRKLIVDTCYLKNKKVKVKDLVWKKRAKSLYEGPTTVDAKPVKLDEGQILADGLEVVAKPDATTYELKETAACTSMSCRVEGLFKGPKSLVEKIVIPIMNRTWKAIKDATSGAKNMSERALQITMNNWGLLLVIVFFLVKYGYSGIVNKLGPELTKNLIDFGEALKWSVGVVLAVKGTMHLMDSKVAEKKSAMGFEAIGPAIENGLEKAAKNVHIDSNHVVQATQNIKHAVIIIGVFIFASSILPYVLDAEKRKGLPKPSFPKMSFESSKQFVQKHKIPILLLLLGVGAGVSVKMGYDKKVYDFIKEFASSKVVKEAFKNFVDQLNKFKAMVSGKEKSADDDEFQDAKPWDERDEYDYWDS